MKTTKPISTISYNTPEYLIIKLKELTKAQKIAFWAFVQHHGESDDEIPNAKDHIHVYMEPACSIQTESIREFCKEPDTQKIGYTLGMMPFQHSKFEDWYLYVLHDRDYLDSKGIAKQFHYSMDDVITPDEDYLYMKVRQIDSSERTPIKKIKQAISLGMTFEDMVLKGWVPIPQLNQYAAAFSILRGQEILKGEGAVDPSLSTATEADENSIH